MSSVDIKEIVSKQGIDSVKQTTVELEKSVLVLQDFIVGAKAMNDVLAKSGTMSQLTKNVQAQEIAQEKLKQATLATQKAELALANARKKQADDAIKLINQQEAASAKNSKRITEDSRLYGQLSRRLEVLRKNAQDVGVQFGVNSFQFEKASKKVVELDDRLKQVDGRLGKFGRNVGNYPGGMGSGFNGLSNSIQQLTREFPAFTFSVQTGFLALSNNIPVFYDQIKQTQASIKALRAEGKPTESLFKQIAKSVLSFGTLLSIGVTLFTVYGKEIGEFITSMFKGTKAVDEFILRQKDLNEALKGSEYSSAIKNVNELAINIDLAKKGFLDKDKVLKQYNETIGLTTGTVKNLDEAEKELTANADKFIQMTLYKAAAQIALDEAAKKAYESEISRRKKLEDFGDSFLDANVSGARSEDQYRSQQANIINNRKRRQQEEIKISEDEKNKQISIAKDFQKQAADIARESGYDFFGGKFDKKEKKGKKEKIDTSEFDVQKSMLEGIAREAKRNIDNEKNDFETRLQALDTYNSASQELIKNDLGKKVKLAKGNKDEIKALNIDAQNQYDDLLADGVQKEIKIREDAQKTLVKNFNDGIKELAELGKTAVGKQAIANAQAQEELSKGIDSTLEALANQYAKGDITREEYDARRLASIREFNEDAAKLEIDGLQDIIDIRKEFGIDTASDEERLAELRKKLARDRTDNEIEALEKIGEAEQKLKEKRQEFAQEAAQFAIEMVNRTFEAQTEKVNEQIKLSEDRKDSEIENVNESILSEQEKENQIATIEAQAEQRKIALEARLQDIEVRKAKFQKIAAIAEIGITLAKGLAAIKIQAAILLSNPLTAAFAGVALAQIPFIIASSALQVASVLAQPIPKFKDGGVMKRDGLAEYGHGVETRIDPDGRMSLTDATPEIGFVKAGTRFINAQETQRMLAKPDKYDFAGKSWDVSELVASNERTAKRIDKSVKSLRIPSMMVTKQGWNKTQETVNKMNKYVKGNFGRP